MLRGFDPLFWQAAISCLSLSDTGSILLVQFRYKIVFREGGHVLIR